MVRGVCSCGLGGALMAKARARPIEERVPIRSLWTCVPTGSQIIVTRASGDWVDFLSVDFVSHGAMRLSELLDKYVKAGDNCRIEARAA